MTETTIGARFRKLRIDNNKTQEEIGELCGNVTKATVSLWENDHSVPPTDRLIMLRQHLVFSLDELLFGMAAIGRDQREQALVQLYRDSDDRGKDTILRVAEQESHYNVEPDSDTQKSA